MSTTTTGKNQSILDVAINNYGSIEAAMEFCAANSLPISNIPAPGTVLEVTKSAAALAAADTGVLATLRRYKIKVGTANLGVCGMLTNLDKSDPTDEGITITFEAGVGAVGVEWAVTTVDAAPSSGTVIGADETELIITGLEPSTDYWAWIRTKCLGNYSGWVRVSFTTTSALPDLNAVVALLPVMKLQTSVMLPNYTISISKKAGDFINIYALLSSWLDINQLSCEDMSAYIIDGGTGAVGIISPNPSMSVGTMNYPTSTAPTPGEYKMFWSDLMSGVVTATFKDVNGNEAVVSPVVVVDDTYSGVGFLVAGIEMDVVSAGPTEVVVRLTRSHTAITVPDMVLESMSWGIGAPSAPDPADPGNDDKVFVTLTAGVHVVEVKGNYESVDGLTAWPQSMIQMVIEVA